MRWIVVLGLACACDRVLGLGHVVAADAVDSHGPFYDAHLTTGCPPIGTTPAYSPLLVQDLVQNCSSYSITATTGLALASCAFQGQTICAAAPVDQPVQEAFGLEDGTCAFAGFLQAAPNGDAYLTCRATATGLNEYRTFQLLDGTWKRGPDALASSLQLSQVPAPSGTTAPHHLVYFNAMDSKLHELVGDLNSWTDTGMHPLSSLDIVTLTYLRLSADGLRMTLYATTTESPNQSLVLYTDRPDPASWFRTAVPIPGVPNAIAIEMTADCSRVYLTGLGSIFYVEEIAE